MEVNYCGLVICRTPTKINMPPITKLTVRGSFKNAIPTTAAHRVESEPKAFVSKGFRALKSQLLF